MKILVSVRSVEEAVLVAGGGVDFIDLKEPSDGALGGLPIDTIRAIVGALRLHEPGLSLSATIGDVPTSDLPRIMACVDEVGACGVDYVKVGIDRAPQSVAVLNVLATCGWPVVPVFIADHGFEWTHVEHACALGFPGVMADTADKLAGSLFDAVALPELKRFVDTVRSGGVGGAMVGLAGALRILHEPQLRALAPDFAGFRTAVCVGDRSSAIDPQRLLALTSLLHSQAIPTTLCV